MVSQNMVSQSKNGFSIKKWFPKIWFLNQKMVSQKMVSQNMVSQSKNGFSIKKWFLNQKMVSQLKNGFPKDGFLKNLVNYMFPNQTSVFSRYPATDSSKCASATDSSCFRAIIECITSYDSSVWFPSDGFI